MPIEIKELHIKINVDEGANRGNNASEGGASATSKADIIATCIEEVMYILEKQKQR
ncbi:DUF5908 family protein [Seonamhaeicola sp.]|uniref:DUF5908 family protein n=1 Tax=Seonamhaeicola sp. TaxID=1912245 RepID=UPI002622914F|nr:DUF5908 family protein [Seonamhaeicola sp.]